MSMFDACFLTSLNRALIVSISITVIAGEGGESESSLLECSCSTPTLNTGTLGLKTTVGKDLALGNGRTGGDNTHPSGKNLLTEDHVSES